MKKSEEIEEERKSVGFVGCWKVWKLNLLGESWDVNVIKLFRHEAHEGGYGVRCERTMELFSAAVLETRFCVHPQRIFP